MNEKRGKSVGFGLLGGVAVTLAVVLPFAWGENIFTWLVDKYAATLSLAIRTRRFRRAT